MPQINNDILSREEFQKRAGMWTANYHILTAHDAALRASLLEKEREIERLKAVLAPFYDEAGELHDKIHNAACLVDWKGRTLGWAPEDSLPILAGMLAERDQWKARAEAESKRLNWLINRLNFTDDLTEFVEHLVDSFLGESDQLVSEFRTAIDAAIAAQE